MDITQWFQVGGSSPLAPLVTASVSSSSSSSSSTGSSHAHQQRQIMEASAALQDTHDRLFGPDTSISSSTTTTQQQQQGRRRLKEDDNTKQQQGNDDNKGNDDDDKQDGEPTGPTSTTTTQGEEQGEATEEPTEGADDTQQQDLSLLDGLETRIDLVKLVPFDIKLMVQNDSNDSVMNTFALTDIVTDWMDESLTAQVLLMELGESHSTFDSVILEERTIQEQSLSTTTTTSSLKDNNNRQLRQPPTRNLQDDEDLSIITIASYEGVTLWKHTTPSNLRVMTLSLLEDLERQALLQDDRLLELLQASKAEGLGQRVTDVRAYINPNPSYVPRPPPLSPTSTTTTTVNANLELIIVVAIVVACMAFAFLVFSLVWAYKMGGNSLCGDNRAASASQSSPSSPQKVLSNGTLGGTDSDYGEDSSKMTPANMHVVVNPRGNVKDNDDDTALEDPAATSVYPESLISDDISTSLTAYYRSGMGTRPLFSNNYLNDRQNNNNDMMNDNASMSSMEFDGYSLDGYAPSLAGNTYINNLPTKGDQSSQAGGDDDDDANDDL